MGAEPSCCAARPRTGVTSDFFVIGREPARSAWYQERRRPGIANEQRRRQENQPTEKQRRRWKLRCMRNAQDAWAAFTSAKQQQPSLLWAAPWNEDVIRAIAGFAAGDITSAECMRLLTVALDRGPQAAGPSSDFAELGEEARTIRQDIRIWHDGWRMAETIHTAFDFNNSYGAHALAADDLLWQSREFREPWAELARGGCRGAPHLVIPSGPLVGSCLEDAVAHFLPAEYELIALTGSGTEAIECFYTLANAFLSITTGEQITNSVLLFFEGAYVGGARALQMANSIEFIANRALAPSHVTADHMLKGPYSRAALEELEAEMEAGMEAEHAGDDSRDTGAPTTPAEGECCDAAELACLAALDARVDWLRRRGCHVGGVVVECVRAKGVVGLRPTFLRALRARLTARRLLMFEDAVMTGLRCGAPFLGCCCRGSAPDFVAVGKAWGFSGVVAHRDATQKIPWREVAARQSAAVAAELLEPGTREFYREAWLKNLNGYITSRISCADVLRAAATLDAVRERGLMSHARNAGKRLRSFLRERGVACWGVGLLIGYDSSTAVLVNVCDSFDRLLPPLSFGEHTPDWERICVVTGAEAALVAERALAFALAVDVVPEGTDSLPLPSAADRLVLQEAREQLKVKLEATYAAPDEMSPGVSSSASSTSTSASTEDEGG